MSSTKTFPSVNKSPQEIISIVRKAWYEGRPVVPIIGAGFSADSGYPILRSICRYLARFKIAMDNNLLLPSFVEKNQRFRKCLISADFPVSRPLSIIESIGWPDRFWLNQTVARNLADTWTEKESRHNHIEKQITKAFSWLSEVSSTTRASNEWDNFIKQVGEFGRDYSWERWAIQGDWRRLIQYFTNYSCDFADDLFAQYGYFRTTSQGHRSLAQLVQFMSIRKIFTFNFDDLIEKSLIQENIQYRVFGMEHGNSLPSTGVVAEMLGIIKMHGSHHSILVDERLDRPLSLEYIKRFYSLVGDKAVLLVMGCSGDDRRLTDLLSSGNRQVDVCWLHFESQPPSFDIEKSAGNIYAAPTNSPGSFVRNLLYSVSSRFPESATPYHSHPRLPIPLGKPNLERLDQYLKNPKSIDDDSPNLRITSSERLLDLSAACINRGFVPIWVDLEAVRTLAGIVGVIIDGCRKVDPELPAAVMPIGDLDEETSKDYAIDRLAFALQRQRYAILIDGLETYGSNLLQHHGRRELNEKNKGTTPLGQNEHPFTTATDSELESLKRIDLLNEFLRRLNDEPIGQSIIFASEVGHAPRRLEKEQRPGKLLQSLKNMGGPDLFWVCMSTIRRTRPLPMLRRLVSTLVPQSTLNDNSLDAFLLQQSKKRNSPIKFLEGGDIWFVRDKRDECYTFATRFTGRIVFKQFQENSETAEKLRACALAQSLLMSMIHKKIASTYFSFEFMQSRDAASFMEYTYHRISSLRNLSRCIYLLETYPASYSSADAELDRIEDDAQRSCPTFKFHTFFGRIWEDWKRDVASDRLKAIRQYRKCDLQALLASWSEFEQSIRSQIPAEQLIHWINEIRDAQVLNRVKWVYVGDLPCSDFDHSSDIKTLVNRLEEYFDDLHARICLERGDFDTSLRLIRRKATADSPAERRKRKLDEIECLVRGQRFDEANTEIDELRGNTPVFQMSDLSVVEDESQHRLYHMLVLLKLRGSSWLEFGIENGLLAADSVDFESALKYSEMGIDIIRGPGALLANSLDGMIVSSGSPGGAYRPYRSVFRTLKGRAKIAQLLTDKSSIEKETDLENFREAMKQFDLAKGGLDSSQSLLRGWADLHAVEGTLMFIRRIFDKHRDLGLIEAKLLGAKSHLLQAITSFRAGRRNAVWWRQYYQLVAQYHTERLLHNLCNVIELCEPREDCTKQKIAGEEAERGLHELSVDILRRYRKGFESIVCYLDNSLDCAGARAGRWFMRTVTELNIATALAISRVEGTGKPFEEVAQLIYTHSESEYPRAELSTEPMQNIQRRAIVNLSTEITKLNTLLPNSLHPVLWRNAVVESINFAQK